MKKSQLKNIIKEIINSINEEFDPGYHDWYLVDAASKLLSTFTPREIAEMLSRKYRIPMSKGLKAVEYAKMYADDKKKGLDEDESDYDSPEAKANREKERKEKSNSKPRTIGGYVGDLGYGNITPRMEELGVKKMKKAGFIMLPYYEGTNDIEYRKKVTALDKETGKSGKWYDARKRKYLS